MDHSQAVQDFQASASKATDQKPGVGPSFTIVMANVDPGQTWITLPEAGSLLVYYEHSDVPAETFHVWHQSGSTTPLRPGQNTVPVKAGDQLVYALAHPVGDVFKFGYKYI
jgi:hypothetical protein